MAAIPRVLLVPTDYGELAGAAAQTAVAIAGGLDASIVLLHAETFDGIADRDEARRFERTRLESYARLHIPQRILGCLELVEETPARAILDAAETHEADLLVMGTHGRAAPARSVLGSVAQTVIRSTERPVITVNRPAESGSAIRSILCCVDFSDSSRAALDQALALSHTIGASLTVLHIVIPGSATEDYAGEALDAWLPPPEPNAHRIAVAIAHGDPACTILELAREGPYDLIALGAGGTLPVAVARHAHCPVLTAHAVRVPELV